MTDRSFLSQAPALSRRGFLRRVSFGVSAITLAGPTALAHPITTGVANGSLGVALVGLGRYAGDELAPALQQTRHGCVALTALGRNLARSTAGIRRRDRRC